MPTSDGGCPSRRPFFFPPLPNGERAGGRPSRRVPSSGWPPTPRPPQPSAWFPCPASWSTWWPSRSSPFFILSPPCFRFQPLSGYREGISRRSRRGAFSPLAVGCRHAHVIHPVVPILVACCSGRRQRRLSRLPGLRALPAGTPDLRGSPAPSSRRDDSFLMFRPPVPAIFSPMGKGDEISLPTGYNILMLKSFKRGGRYHAARP